MNGLFRFFPAGMIMMKTDVFFRYLSDFTNTLGSILAIVPSNIKPIYILSNYVPIKFEANINVKGLHSRDYYIYLGLNGHVVREGSSKNCNLTLSGELLDWIAIFKNKQTLLGACNMGKIDATGVREHFILRMTLYSELIQNFNTRIRILGTLGKLLKIFSKSILRETISRLYSIVRIIPLPYILHIIKRRGK
jgi:hypothetical protein